MRRAEWLTWTLVLGIALESQTVFSAPEAASSTSAQPAQDLAAIIVTARRREERLQDVPIAITVKSQEELTQQNVQSIADLQHSVPSLTMYGPFRNTPIVSIRGQGGYAPGGIPAVVLYLNEIPMATSAQAGSPGGALGGNGLFFDLENVQVLKGPQGTLFGRNTTGGAILLQSRRPSRDFEGHLTATAGNYQDREIDAAINVPLNETSEFRLAVNGQERDGFTRVQASPAHPNGIDLDDASHFSVRGSLNFRVGQALENLLITDLIRSNTNGTSAILRAVNANPLFPVNRLFPGAAQLVSVQNSLGIRDQVPLSVDMRSELNRWSITNITTFRVSDTLTVKNIASYSRARYWQTIDGDGTAFPIFDPIAAQEKPYVTRQYTEELQLQGGAFDGRLDWVGGLFYLNQPEEDEFTRHTSRIFGGTRFIGFKQFERSAAIYLQGTHNLSSLIDGLSATLGIRHTWETIGRANRDQLPSGACTSPYMGADCAVSMSDSFKAPTWTIGINYEPGRDKLLYLVSRRGFRSGGFNLADGALPQDRVFKQEYVTDLEIGSKSRWDLGGSLLTTNLALYRQYYSDIQLSQTSISTITGGQLNITMNAGKAHIDGLEFEGSLLVGDRFELTSHFAYSDYKFTRVNPGVVLPIHLTNIPRTKYGVGLRYNLPRMAELGQVSVSADWNWQDDVFLTNILDPLARQPAYGLLTLGATWRDLGAQPLDLSLFVTNVTDKEYAIGGLPMTGILGTATLAYGAPRMWGLRLAYRFGANP